MATLGAGSSVHTDLTMQPGQARAPGRRRTLRWLCSAPSHHWTVFHTRPTTRLPLSNRVLCVLCWTAFQTLALAVLCAKPPSDHFPDPSCGGALAPLGDELCVVCRLGGPSACARPLPNLVLSVLCTKRMWPPWLTDGMRCM